jgi:hypothetical protein
MECYILPENSENKIIRLFRFLIMSKLSMNMLQVILHSPRKLGKKSHHYFSSFLIMSKASMDACSTECKHYRRLKDLKSRTSYKPSLSC